MVQEGKFYSIEERVFGSGRRVWLRKALFIPGGDFNSGKTSVLEEGVFSSGKCVACLVQERVYDSGGRLEGGGAHSFVTCLSHLTIDHAYLLRRSTVPIPNRGTSNILELMTFFPSITYIQ